MISPTVSPRPLSQTDQCISLSVEFGGKNALCLCDAYECGNPLLECLPLLCRIFGKSNVEGRSGSGQMLSRSSHPTVRG